MSAETPPAGRAPAIAARLTCAAAVIVAVLPVVVLAAKLAIQRPAVPLAGDQAVVQLAAINAGHRAQLLGPYSRFGWHHPGPSWFYILDGAFLPLGSHGWSLLVATLLLHGVIAASIVVLVARWRGHLAALLTALLLLVFFAAFGADHLVTPWNPYAIVLPTVLLLVLAGAAAAGSVAAVLGLLLIGSFMVQTHVSTLPAVAVVIVVAGLLALRNLLRPLRDETPPPTIIFANRRRTWRERASLAATLAPAPLIVLMWVPPLIDQFTNRPGNLRALQDFFTSSHGDHGLVQGMSSVARMLVVFPFGHYDDTSVLAGDTVPASRWLALVVFVVLCAGLVYLGQRLGERFAQGIAIACLAAAATAAWSVTRITGALDPFLLTWVIGITVALAIGYASIVPALLRLIPESAMRAVPARLVALGPPIVAGALILAVLPGRVSAFASLRAEDQTPTRSAPIQDAVANAVRDLPPGPLLVVADSGNSVAWPVATGITLRLVQDGRTVEVPDSWVFLWGDQFRPRHHPVAGRILVVTGDRAPTLASQPNLRQVATGVDVVIFVSPGGAS